MKGQRFHLQHSSETVSISATNGIYLERWDRIDYKRVKFLLTDPRYPRLPSKTICLPDFQQPQSWADYFGARARTYFVPQQTGIYRFMLCESIYFDSKNLYLSLNQACKKEEFRFVSVGVSAEPAALGERGLLTTVTISAKTSND